MKKIWSYLSIPAAALAVLTGSIAWVLLLRPFYYVQIGPLGVCQASGLTAAQARAAYSDVMDYCLGLRPDFAAGVLPFSAEGASHFADVRVLFILDLAVLAVTLLFLLGLWITCRRRHTALPRLGGRTPGFWAACGLGGGILIVAVLAVTDFDRAFTIFHGVFFPGKENWLFDPATDPVILLLPEEFFRRCAIAIAASLLLLCLVLALTGRKQKNKALLAALCKKNTHASAWCSLSGSDLPLAGLPIAVGEDHIVQIALDPLVGHCAITLLSSLFYDTVYPGSEKNTRTKFYIYTKN